MPPAVAEPGGAARRRRPVAAGPAVVALGGGHGLAVTLRALRGVTDQLTAIVGMADDGGSSGRLRRDMGTPPPGDLRMALAALCGDDVWGRTWSSVVQHRFSAGELAGHAMGNLLITSLWEQTGDVVAGLDWVAALLGAHGRVLPVCSEGVEIIAEVLDAPGHPGISVVRGQSMVAVTRGHRPVDLPRAARSARPAGGDRGHRPGRGDRDGPRVLVHLRPGRAPGSRHP